MPDLIAQGTDPQKRWRKGLPELAAERDVMLGRQPSSIRVVERSGDGDLDRRVLTIAWAIPWDLGISRHHARLVMLSGDRVEVHRDPRSKNPIFYRGKPRDSFTMVPGEHFVISETTFTLARRPGFADQSPMMADLGDRIERTPKGQAMERGGTPTEAANPQDHLAHTPHAGAGTANVTEWAFDEVALRTREFKDATSRINLLARLPDLVTGSVDDEELFVRVADVLLRATTAATAVAIVRADLVDAPEVVQDPDRDRRMMRVLHYDSRLSDATAPGISSRLVAKAVRRRESVLHVWEASVPLGADFTASDNVDWAFCVPLQTAACAGWAFYVTGTRAAVLADNPLVRDSKRLADLLADDLKFTEVVASLVAGVRQAGQLQQQQAAMRRFFAPVVLDAMVGQDPQAWLQPRQCDLSVMFCDLRGFSQTSELHADQLLLLLEQVSAALGVMTRHILNTGGVIGDFHGDAAMGFWGWPMPLGSGDDALASAALAAARAGRNIRLDYAAGQTDFRCGIGIATGGAVAGRIGTVDQVKVTAFGPVVNLASRLEGLTKAFGVEILIDRATADLIRPHGVPIRSLGRVRVAGMKKPVTVFQLLVEIEGQPMLTQQQIETYHAAWDAFAEGRWDVAYQQLHELPAWDRPKDVLMRMILQHHRTAPPDWDGVLDFPK